MEQSKKTILKILVVGCLCLAVWLTNETINPSHQKQIVENSALLRLMEKDSELNESVLVLKGGVRFDFDRVSYCIGQLESEMKKTSSMMETKEINSLLDRKLKDANEFRSSFSAARNSIRSLHVISAREPLCNFLRTQEIMILVNQCLVNVNNPSGGLKSTESSLYRLIDELEKEAGQDVTLLRKHVDLLVKESYKSVRSSEAMVNSFSREMMENRLEKNTKTISEGDKKNQQRMLIAIIVVVVMIIAVYILLNQLIRSKRNIEKQVEIKTALLKKQNDQLQQTVESLELHQKDLKQVVYALHHQFRTPLRGISSLASWLSEDLGEAYELKPDELKNIQLIGEKSQLLGRLYNAFIAYLSLNGDKVEESAVEVQALFLELKTKIPEGVNFHVQSDAPLIYTSRKLILLCLEQLLYNSIQFNSKEEKEVSVSVKSGKNVQIVVTDNGDGMDERYILKVMEPFQKLSNGSSDSSSEGIGLSLVSKALSILGGSFKLNSTPGKGTQAIINLPIINDYERS